MTLDEFEEFVNMDESAPIAGEMSDAEILETVENSSNAGNGSDSDSEPEPLPLTLTQKMEMVRNLRQFFQENGMDMASTVTEVESLVFLHASQAKKNRELYVHTSLQLTKQHYCICNMCIWIMGTSG